MYNEALNNVKSSLSSATNVALTTDGWTGRATVSYITITSTHISPNWTLGKFVLQTRAMPDSHTGSNIARVIQEAIVEWGLPPHPPLVTDNAANMVVAAKELRSQPHIGCFAHCLNLAAQKALKINSVTKILPKVRRIVSFFHRSTTAAALLKAKIKLTGLKELKLIQDVATRWNSAADMLERYLLLQPAIYATFLSKELIKQESNLSTLNETDTRMAEDIMETLLPMREITTAICTEKVPTVSVILPLLKRLSKTMQTDTNDSAVKRQVKQAIMENISTRYTSVELQDFLQECTILDPRLKFFFESETQFTILNRLVSLALSSVSSNTVKVEKEEATQDVSSTQTSLHFQCFHNCHRCQILCANAKILMVPCRNN